MSDGGGDGVPSLDGRVGDDVDGFFPSRVSDEDFNSPVNISCG